MHSFLWAVIYILVFGAILTYGSLFVLDRLNVFAPLGPAAGEIAENDNLLAPAIMPAAMIADSILASSATERAVVGRDYLVDVTSGGVNRLMQIQLGSVIKADPRVQMHSSATVGTLSREILAA